MYTWLIRKWGIKKANVLIVVWYLFLAFLVILSFSYEGGRFKYAEW